MKRQATLLVFLEWPERCFRASAADASLLAQLAPRGSRVVRVRTERSFLHKLPRATHAIVWHFRKEWFSAARNLRVLATPAAGREFVPEDGPPGIKVHFGSFHGPIMAETVAAFVLAWSRGFFALRNAPRREGRWPRTWLSDKCSMVAGTRAVVAGFGNIGRAVGEKLESLGVSVCGIARRGCFRGAHTPIAMSRKAMDAEIARADWFVMALPSTPETDGFLGERLISMLPRKCVVVNVGRGNAVDEKALFRALSSGRLAGAYLDVRRSEPSASILGKPGFEPRLGDLPNCVTTPHSAAFDSGYLARCFEELAEEGLLS